MKYRTLPHTGLSLPVVGFGTGDNAGLMVAGRPKDQVEAVARALDLGVSYFDTSPDYGLGVAEENLGRALGVLGASAVICSKVEVMPTDLGDVAGAVIRSVEGSLSRLGVERIEILQIHNGPAMTRVLHNDRWGALEVGDYLAPGGALDGLEQLRAQGKVGVLGFTCAHADSVSARELIDTGAFGLVNVWYNLLNPSAGMAVPEGLGVDRDYDDIIGYASARGVGVAVFRPLAGGALTGQATGGVSRHRLAGGQISRDPKPFQQDLARAGALVTALGLNGAELTRLAYRFALDHPGVTTVLGGFSDIAQLQEMAAAADEPGLTDGERAQILRVWHNNFESHQEVR